MRVDGRQPTPPLKQRGRRQAATRKRSQFGDRMPIHGDRKRLAASDALQHSAAVVAEFADGDVIHAVNVSRVRHVCNSARCEPNPISGFLAVQIVEGDVGKGAGPKLALEAIATAKDDRESRKHRGHVVSNPSRDAASPKRSS